METTLPRVPVAFGRGALVGAAGGAIFGVLSGLAYFATNMDQGLPWIDLGVVYVPYAIVSGALVAGCAAGAIALLDVFVGKRTWAAPLPAAMIGGALGCMLPGAFGGGYFAKMHAPFMGGIGIFAIPIIGTILVAIALAAHDRANAGRKARIGVVTLVAIGFAMLGGAAVASSVLSITDDRMLGHLRDCVAFFTPNHPESEVPAWDQGRTGLVIVGSFCGLALGGGLGTYVGSVMSLARKIT